MLAVQGATLQNCYRAKLKRYRMLQEHIGAIAGVTKTLLKHCVSLLDVTEHCRTLWKQCGSVMGVLRSVMEHYRALWDVSERYGSVADPWNVPILPISN